MKYSLLTISTCFLFASCTQRESVPRPAPSHASVAIVNPAPDKKPDFMVEGVGPDKWLMKEMKILVNPDAKGVLTISATPLNPANQPADNAIEVNYLGKPLQSCDYIAGIKKDCEVDLVRLTGKPNDKGWQELVFITKRQFVPKDLGINADTRSLAFQVNNVTIADKPQFVVEGIGPDQWLMKEMKILVNPAAKGLLSLTATPVNLPHQPTDNAIVVSHSGKLLQTCEYKVGVQKTCDVDLARLTDKPNDKGWRELLFTTKRQFVPKDLGINAETRGLSFLVDKVSIEEKPMFVTEGIGPDKWLMKEMKILVNPDAKGILTITATPIILPHQPTDNAITVNYSGKLLLTCEYAAATKKCVVDLAFLSGKPNDLGWHELTLNSKRQFVPKTLGINADTRNLSFRVDSISIVPD